MEIARITRNSFEAGKTLAFGSKGRFRSSCWRGKFAFLGQAAWWPKYLGLDS